jgi:uncharacterized membrane protein
MDLLWLKLVHIVGATLLLGTGLGTAFFMWTAHRGGDPRAIAVTARHVVLADTVFTAPAVVVQPATGVWMALELGYPVLSGWILWTIVLYLVTGACWLPVVWLQVRAARLAREAVAAGADLPPRYFRLMRAWFWLGWPAFAAVLGIVWLMVFKPDL